jgi:hypothetical protein
MLFRSSFYLKSKYKTLYGIEETQRTFLVSPGPGQPFARALALTTPIECLIRLRIIRKTHTAKVSPPTGGRGYSQKIH